MTNDERDLKITQTFTIVERLSKVIEGNGQAGLSDRLARVEERQLDCPAREAYALANQRASVANAIQWCMLAVAILAAVAAWLA